MTTAENVEKWIKDDCYRKMGFMKGALMICEVWKQTDKDGIIDSKIVIEILGEKLAKEFFQKSTTDPEYIELTSGHIWAVNRYRSIDYTKH